ncbi:hypothetical protein PIB30_045787 [Stylosanthes scabra]|uniref:Uncharacterized protein n=1 Tax=Stylosanthes scabra TaxID=79078 RepID=A0ABU6XH68_9FABA|nr:hypothetical protein [Stylosanthes scabra]
MAHELFYFVVHPNGVIVRREKGALFESNDPVMFAHNRVNTLRELKQLILYHLGSEVGREIGNLAYQFQALTANDRLEYRPSWINEDSHVWMTFEVHKRVMDGKVMEFYRPTARHIICSSAVSIHAGRNASHAGSSLSNANLVATIRVSCLSLLSCRKPFNLTSEREHNSAPRIWRPPWKLLINPRHHKQQTTHNISRGSIAGSA